jgi:hypothetical protein
MELASVAAELYGLRPEEFTPTRNEHAKTARANGDRALADAIRGLRKPSAAAWVVNMLAHTHPEELDRVVELGADLRQAQQDRDGEALRELNRRRQEVLSAVAARARDVAAARGQRVSASVGTEVEQTLWAAMTDGAAASAVRSGLLTSPLVTTGLGPVDLSGAVAVPSAVPAEGEPPERARAGAATGSAGRAKKGGETEQGSGTAQRGRRQGRALVEARERAAEAEREATQAAQELAEVEQRVEEARSRREELAAEVEELRGRLRWAEKQADRADREVAAAEREHEQAERRASRAGRDAEKARSRVDRLEDGGR